MRKMDWIDRLVWFGVAVIWVISCIVAYAQIREIPERSQRTMYELRLPAEGYVPDTVVIRQALKDTALVCAEPVAGGTVSCRTVKEFRVWVVERTSTGMLK